MRSRSKVLIFVLLLSGFWQLGQAGWIQGKAWVAQYLIKQAWQKTQLEKSVRPWPWTDTWPVARLQQAEHNVDLYVLAGAQGNSLAFGPGHLFGSALPGNAGVTVVGGHRDTRLAFLQHLKVGDMLQVQGQNKQSRWYQVSHMRIADSRAGPLTPQVDGDVLILVTCYPFNAISAGGPMRYVVTAVASNKSSGSI